MPRDYGSGKSRPDEQVFGVYADAPDVEWTCSTFEGIAVLCVQASGPGLVSSNLFLRNYKKVEVMFHFDIDKLPEAVPTQFVCVVNDDHDAPVLVTEPDDLLMPLRIAVTEGEPWLFVVQGKDAEGNEQAMMMQVMPDWSVHPLHVGYLDHWIVGIV